MLASQSQVVLNIEMCVARSVQPKEQYNIVTMSCIVVIPACMYI